MSRPPRTPDDRWHDLMDGLADSVADASDEDILEEARDAHGDAGRRAEEIRVAMLKSVDALEADSGDRRALPFVAAAPATASERWTASWRLAAAAAAAVVAGSLTFAALWRPGAPEVAVTQPPVVNAQPPVALPQPTPPVVTDSGDSATNTAVAEPGQQPAPPPPQPHKPPMRRTPAAVPGDTPPDTPPPIRFPTPHTELAKVRTVSIDFVPKTPSATATALRDEIVRQLGDGGQLTPIDDRQAADARLRITEAPRGHFAFLFIADGREIWNEPTRVAGPADVNATAERIAQRVTSTVLDARQQTGASQ